MIGLFAIGGYPPASLADFGERISNAMLTRPNWEASLFTSADVACGRIGPKRQGSTWTSPDKKLRAWLDGVAVRLDRNGATTEVVACAQSIAQELLAEGPDALLGFGGEYFLLVLDERRRKLLAATDRFGLRTTYWCTSGNTFAIGSELRPFLRLGLVSSILDKPFVSGLLRFQKCRMADRTIFQGVGVVPPGTVQSYDLNHPGRAPAQQRYYTHRLVEDDRTEDEWVDTLLPLLQRAVTWACEASTGVPALALSGGLDSRMVLGALNGKASVQTFSCGLPQSDDVRLAERAAHARHKTHRNVDLGPDDYLHWARTSVLHNEEFDIFVQGGSGALYRQAATTAGTLMTGWDLDVPLRGTYLDDDVLQLNGTEPLSVSIDRKWRLFSREELARMWLPGLARDNGEVVEEWVADFNRELAETTPQNRYLLFIFQFEKRRLLMLRNRMIRFDLESLTPFYYTELQKELAGVPLQLKVRDRLFARVFNQLAPDLARIPYQRTMLPPSVPVEFWERAKQIETRREDLLREIATSAGMLIPYTHHYTNFDEWLRKDPPWRSFVNDLLQSPDTRLTQVLFQPDAIRELIAKHNKQSQRTKLIYLMSLELYLREYFS